MSCDNHHGNGEPANPDPTREPPASLTPSPPPSNVPDGELLEVNLEPAWSWKCPRCQTMNYIADTGTIQASVVTCCLCNTTYESNEPLEEIDDDDIDDDWDDEDDDEYCLDDDDDDIDDDSDVYDDDDDDDGDFYDWEEDEDDFLGDDGPDMFPGAA